MGRNRRLGQLKALCICTLSALLLSGCANGPTDEKTIVVDNSEKTVAYNYATVERGDVIGTKRIRCTYRQQSEVEQSFQLTGRVVDEVYVKEGDYVKKGDVLATLTLDSLNRDIEDLQYRIKRAELQLSYIDKDEELDIQNAWVNYLSSPWQSEEGKESVEEQIEGINQNYRYQRENYEDSLEFDRKRLENLQREKNFCSLRAEMDGLVYKLKNRLQGSTSKKDEVVITIADNSQCLFETAYDEEVAESLKTEEFLEMVVNTGNASGTYTLTPFEPEQWTDKMMFKVYDGPYTSGLEVGTSGTMTVVTHRKEDVLSLPATVIHEANGKYYVYTADQEGMRQVTWIETGIFGDTFVEITGGLKEGDKVIAR